MMKHIFLLASLFVGTLAAHAQTTTQDSLKEYTGTYRLGTGDDADNAVVELHDKKLNIAGRAGAADLSRQQADTFAVDEYGGTVIFLRDSVSKKIARIKVNIPAGGIDSEGVKIEVEAPAKAMLNKKKEEMPVAMAQPAKKD